MIRYQCCSCGTPLESPDSLAGGTEPCPVCKTQNRVPVKQGANRGKLILGAVSAVVAALALGSYLGYHFRPEPRQGTSIDTAALPSTPTENNDSVEAVRAELRRVNKENQAMKTSLSANEGLKAVVQNLTRENAQLKDSMKQATPLLAELQRYRDGKTSGTIIDLASCKPGSQGKDLLGSISDVQVVVEDLPEAITKVGVTKEMLKTQTELSFRKAGITVKDDSLCHVYVNVNGRPVAADIPILAFNVICDVERVAVVLGTDRIGLVTVTNPYGGIGVGGDLRAREGILRLVQECTDMALNDLLAANPKR